MTKRARGMNVDKIRAEDVARSGGAPEEGELALQAWVLSLPLAGRARFGCAAA